MLRSSFTPDKIEAGCDEVGRGPLAGPVVAAAVILPKLYQNFMLDDSKKMSKSNREALEIEIKEVAIAWAIAEVSPQEIDEINILNASFLAMHRSIEKLKTAPELLLIDGNRFNPYQEIPYECIIKGDGKFLSIAAASVIAKTYRDNLMAEAAIKYPGYGWESNAGYPTKKHRAGILELGPTPIHRMSFRLLPEEQKLI